MCPSDGQSHLDHAELFGFIHQEYALISENNSLNTPLITVFDNVGDSYYSAGNKYIIWLMCSM